MWSRNALQTCSRSTSGALKRSTRALATAVDAPASTSSSAPPAAPSASGSKSLRAGINTAIILNRAPILTRAPTPFEKAYYQYQQRIQRALHNPFAYDFYFKPGAPLEGAFNLAEAKRDRKAFGKGFGMDAEGAFAPPAAGAPELGAEEEEPTAPRFTAADEKGDVKSLDRYGQRNLYLLIQKKVGGKQVWAFPEGGVESDELLHEAAERELVVECGPDMNTWIVSRKPIGVYQAPATGAETNTFFFKAHIMAGQARPAGKDAVDFAWLTKQEIEGRVDPHYWAGVKDMLSDF